MSDLEEIIEIANRICERLDRISENEKKICTDVSLQIEKWSWDIYKMSNDLKTIKDESGL